MAKKIKCPRFGCGSTDVEYLSGNQTFRCKKCGRVFEVKL